MSAAFSSTACGRRSPGTAARSPPWVPTTSPHTSSGSWSAVIWTRTVRRSTVDDVILGCANQAGVEPQRRTDGSPAGGLPAEGPGSSMKRSTTPPSGGVSLKPSRGSARTRGFHTYDPVGNRTGTADLNDLAQLKGQP